jgi:hypothetical protein
MKKLFTLIIIGMVGYGLYFLFDETQMIQKSQCLAVGKDPVLSTDLGLTDGKVRTICAEPTTDGNKDCYDSSECVEACILSLNADDYAHTGEFINKMGADVRGYCQPYYEMDCFVERNRGMIVLNKCLD